MTDVVIVGGGPIGLAHAWGLKKINPNLKIVVLEKRPEYERSHNLNLKYRQLEKLLDATNAHDDPDLGPLLKKLKENPHIRTNELEQIFKSVALKAGVVVDDHCEIKAEQIKQQIFEKYPDAKLIIGADGTHSVVNKALFPEGNQKKYKFDYALQLRYEVEGNVEAIDSISFYQQMSKQGLIGTEIIGRLDKGKTPVTMQLIISEESFNTLQPATSKNPIKPFAPKKDGEIGEEHPVQELPKDIQKFIFRYLKLRAKKSGKSIDKNSVRISVNELPALEAEQVFIPYPQDPKNGNPVYISLGGDAALGLSYFKGLNASLEATAYYLRFMKDSIKQNFADSEKLKEGLSKYQEWFKPFAKRKIKEVEDYSTHKVRSVWKAIKTIRAIKGSVSLDPDDGEIQQEVLADYFNLLARDKSAESDSNLAFREYPHRKYDPVTEWQFDYIPVTHSLKKTAKLFVDFFKPYKSETQIKQDFKTPIIGLANIGIGLLKLFAGFFLFNPKRFADGLFSILRGLIELAATPLILLVKPFTRGIATGLASLANDKVTIESGDSFTKLVDHGVKSLDEIKDAEQSPQKIHALLAVCNDLHRKFTKAKKRGQATSIQVSEEQLLFEKAKAGNDLSETDINNYFTLFAKKAHSESTNEIHNQIQTVVK